MRNRWLGLALSWLVAVVGACGGSETALDDAPIANAGADQAAATGSVVTLDGSQSRDPRGQPITYRWAFVEVPARSRAALSDATVPRPTFTVDVAGTYDLELVVSNGKLSSEPSEVRVTATTSNAPPTASAGADQRVAVGAVVALDGRGSHDPDDDPLTYLWSFVSTPEGSRAGIENPTSAQTLFVADTAGEYVVQLLVSDGVLTSTPNVVTVTASVQNVAPVANAGADQAVTTGVVVNLDGGGSTDADGDSLTYLWTFVSRPAGSNAGIQDPGAAQTLFVADVAGQYVLQLVVADGKASSAPDTLVVTAASVAVPSMTGVWAGSTTVAGVTASIDLALIELPGGAVTGSGALELGGTTTPGLVTGTHTHPNVSLVAGAPPLTGTYDGTFSDSDTVVGHVTVNESPPIPLTIHRQ